MGEGEGGNGDGEGETNGIFDIDVFALFLEFFELGD